MVDSAKSDVWLLSFRIHLYAGLQVLLQALMNGQTLVVPNVASSPQDVVELMATHNVTCASATPSYWRRLVLFCDPARLATVPLRQLTLGGELADQPLLSSLGKLFPRARIVHIYATTELGRCFAVTDGQAGFPRSYLDHESSDSSRARQVDARLKVDEGQLFVKPIHGMDRAETHDSRDETTDDWMPTGDLVEVTEDRILFAGRAGDMINVGGNKVRPALVEAAIRTVAGVDDVRVFGQRSSIAGQLVACEIVVAKDAAPAEIESDVRAACRAALQPHQCPRLIQVVPEIAMSEAGKTKRS
jgi:acyl-CoA synthetase (AMP-forming)/AMP-acid ligase II